MRDINKIKSGSGLYLSSALFLLFYLIISFINHTNFRTNWFDLGLYTNHLYHYSHFNFQHLAGALGDHFDLLLVLFSPLQYIFGSYTLLLIQIVFIIVGGRGVYLVSLQFINNKTIALFSQIAFCFSFGVLSAVAFDYHSNVIAACLVPYLFYYYNTGNRKGFIFAFVLIFLSKENMVLWLGFILSILPFIMKDNKALKKTSLLLAGFCLISFYLISTVFMPLLAGADGYPNFKYTTVGDSHSFSDVAMYLISHPIESLKLLFKNTSGNGNYDDYKTEAHVFILLAGGILLFIKPAYLWMLIPIYLQKFLHDSENTWGLAYQYNIEFMPVILIMLVDCARKINKDKLRIAFLSFFFILNVALSFRLMDRTACFIKHSAIRVYQSSHYVSDYNKAQVTFLMSQIPDEASVSAQTVFTPHLAFRYSIKPFKGGDESSDFILISNSDDTYPLSKAHFKEELHKLFRNNGYKLKLAFERIYLFEKKVK